MNCCNSISYISLIYLIIMVMATWKVLFTLLLMHQCSFVGMCFDIFFCETISFMMSLNNVNVPGRRTWTHTSFCREFIILPDAHIKSFDTYFNLSTIYHLYVLFVKNSLPSKILSSNIILQTKVIIRCGGGGGGILKSVEHVDIYSE